MKLFICADMEGATGITHREQLLPEGKGEFERGRRLLTGDVNAAVEAAIVAGAKEVLVSEGHAGMRNLLIEDLHPHARIVQGPPSFENKPHCQILGLDETFDLALFIGFHSRAGTPGGLLAHTWSGGIVHEVTLNGEVVGETAINAAICGSWGVPVGLVTGGDDVCREAVHHLGQIETVAVKKVHGYNIAECWGPLATWPRIEKAAARAVARYREGQFTPMTFDGPVVAELEVHRREMADKMYRVPELERIGERRLRTTGANARDALSTLWHGVTQAMTAYDDWLR